MTPEYKARRAAKHAAKKANVPEIAWHYTYIWDGRNFPKPIAGLSGAAGIIASGHIRLGRPPEEPDRTDPLSVVSTMPPAEATALIAKCKGAVPLVWFSTNQFWENTTVGQMPINVLVERGIGIARFGVKTSSLVKWMSILDTIPREARLDLIGSGRECGANPEEWYVSRIPVTKDRWVAVQKFDGVKWVDVDVNEAEEFSSRLSMLPSKHSHSAF